MNVQHSVLQSPLESRTGPSELTREATMHTEAVPSSPKLIHPQDTQLSAHRLLPQRGASKCSRVALDPPRLSSLVGCFSQERGWNLLKSRKSQSSGCNALSAGLGNSRCPDSVSKESLHLPKVKRKDRGHLISSREFFLYRH